MDLADRIAHEAVLAKQAATREGRTFMRSDLAEVIRRMLPTRPIRASKKPSPEAEKIYLIYPRHVAPDEAKKAIDVALQKVEYDYLLAKTTQFAEAVNSWPSSYRYTQDGRDTCPYPATWFNKGRYLEEASEWKRFGARKPASHQYIAPPEPEGWRDMFPDFVDRHKEWKDLQPEQHRLILQIYHRDS